MDLRSLISAALLSTLITGCALFKPPIEPGMTSEQVYIAMGNPSAVYPDGKGGRVLEWPTNDYSQYAYMAEMNANGQVVWYGNVRTEKRFAQIKINRSTKEDVLRTIGHPSEAEYLALRKQEVWSYRYKEEGIWNSMMHFYFNANGIVTHMEKGMDDLDLRDGRGFFGRL